MATFIDRVVMHLQAGSGGNGCVSARREKFKPLGGPDGGNGGHGGSIVLVSDPTVTTLLDFHRNPHRRSSNGGPGMGDHRHGRNGEEIELRVPLGTVAKSSDGNQLVDLTQPGVRFVIAAGGQGGLGNASLASTKRKAPGFALRGTSGWEGDIELELKTLADVALVGFPSAGKSSLIAVLSSARPKIADYPFTTLSPHLGVVQAGDVKYTVADVPGLIEGASEGKGLGLDFLRHVERCSALVHILDCAAHDPDRNPESDLDIILGELAAYSVPVGQKPLLDRQQVVVLNKIDVPEARDRAGHARIRLESRGYRVFEISATTREGVRGLSFELASLVERDRRVAATEANVRPRVVIRPRAVDESGFSVRVEGGSYGAVYRIIGAKPERWIAQTDFTNDEAVGFLADRLAKLGVEDELVKAGASPGSTVIIGPGKGVVFDWDPTLASTTELIAAPRGADSRFEESLRPTREQRRVRYVDRMDAKAAARAEMAREREAGLWRENYRSDDAAQGRGEIAARSETTDGERNEDDAEKGL